MASGLGKEATIAWLIYYPNSITPVSTRRGFVVRCPFPCYVLQYLPIVGAESASWKRFLVSPLSCAWWRAGKLFVHCCIQVYHLLWYLCIAMSFQVHKSTAMHMTKTFFETTICILLIAVHDS